MIRREKGPVLNISFKRILSVLMIFIIFMCFSTLSNVSARDSVYTQKGSGPMYWSTYEYQQSNNTYMDENVFKSNIDWLYSSGLAASGYNMVVTDGWGRAYNRVNSYGYLTTHDDSWVNTYSYWVSYLSAKNMQLGVYANPLWLTHAVVTDPDSRTKYIVKGTSIPVLDLKVTVQDGFNCVDVTKNGAEQYIKGYVQHFIDIGAKYLRIDFLRNYENTMGAANYATALRWMHEAAGNQIELSLVMPNLYDHGKNELMYGDLVRIDDDALLEGWVHISSYERGTYTPYWSQYGNAFDGFIGFSDISGKSGTGSNKLILDGDFLRLNAYPNDTERKFALSIFAMAGSPLSFCDQYNTCGASSVTLMKNANLISLNTAGFAGRPMVIDILNAKSQIWKGRLPTGEWIVGLFNRESTNRSRSINFARDLGISGNATVLDMWTNTSLGSMSSYTVNLAAHDVKLLKITGTTVAQNYIQAEHATMLGNAHVYVDNQGAYNNNGVGYIGATSDGIQFSNVASGSTLNIRYANGTGTTSKLDLYVNGTFNQTMNFSATSGWTGQGAYNVATANVTIPAGATLKLMKNSTAGSVNVDFISVGSGGPPTITTVAEAEDGEVLGYLTDTYYDVNASNSQGVGYIDSVGDGLQWRNVSAASALTIRYASGVNSQLSLYINGVKSQTVSFTSTGDWYTYSNKPVTVSIPAGATVKLQFDSGDSAANIDKITLGSGGQTLIPITNGGFESGNFNGWTVSGTSGASGVDTVTPHGGTYKAWYWKTSTYNQTITQTKTGLVNGSYTVKAWVRQDLGTPTTCRMQLTNYGGSQVNVNIPHTTTTYQQISGTVNVTNEQITIAFYSSAPGNTNLCIDDVELWKNN